MPATEAALCVSIHDVAPATWAACRALLQMLDALGPVPVTLLVVPDYHRLGRLTDDPAFVRALEARIARGDEPVLHGYYHWDDAPRPRGPWDYLRRRAYTAGEGEFSALDAATARTRLEQGLALFRGLGWPVTGFVPPAWLLGRGAWAALAGLPFRYTATLRGLYRLPDRRFVASQPLVYSTRTAGRRRLSRRWNARLFERLRANGLLRLSLHPADAAHPEVLRHWQLLLTRALETRRPLTKQAYVRLCLAS